LLLTDAHCLVIILSVQCDIVDFRKAALRNPLALADMVVDTATMPHNSPETRLLVP